MMHSFLMIGQSNMAGRGYLKEVPVICDEHIKMLRNGLWQMMIEPMNYDRPFAGIGPAASFAASWRKKHPTEEIGLIPCAEGATNLDDWAVGGLLFEHAVFQAKLAQRTSHLDGILWHQGENNCVPDGAKLYCEKFQTIVETLRNELNSPEIPIIMGDLGDYLLTGKYGAYFKEYPFVNQAIQEFANTHDHCYFVTAAGLTPNPDNIHFNASSQRVLGIRYFEAYDQRKNIVKPLNEEEAMVTALHDRPLSKTEKKALVGNEFGKGNLSLCDYEAQLSAIDEA